MPKTEALRDNLPASDQLEAHLADLRVTLGAEESALKEAEANFYMKQGVVNTLTSLIAHAEARLAASQIGKPDPAATGTDKGQG